MATQFPDIKFIRMTENRKTGYIPVVYSDKTTCPDSCPFKQTGCYAKTGLTRFAWNRLKNSGTNTKWNSFLAEIRDLPSNQLWRYGVAGDLPGKMKLFLLN